MPGFYGLGRGGSYLVSDILLLYLNIRQVTLLHLILHRFTSLLHFVASVRDAIALKTTHDKGNSKESLNFKSISDCLVADGTLQHPITLVPVDLYNLFNGNSAPCR
jgi:hypothetical protein